MTCLACDQAADHLDPITRICGPCADIDQQPANRAHYDVPLRGIADDLHLARNLGKY